MEDWESTQTNMTTKMLLQHCKKTTEITTNH